MREGFTTGSCAAAAALASCLWQRDGECPTKVEIVLPEGRTFAPSIIRHEAFTCGVIKDSGDDPDVTNGCEVCASVAICAGDGGMEFRAGCGVGIITRPGLKLPPGEAAINPVPRAMIEKAVRSVYAGRAAVVTVSIPAGVELAGKTFNPRLGIRGGLSVLGTSGVVRPMSEEALTQSIALEISVRYAADSNRLALVFGNQGEQALKKLYPGISMAQMSNFVGFAFDSACAQGFRRVLIAGHPGKLAKVSAGVMQTHSKYGDARRESIAAQLALLGADRELIARILDCLTTESAIHIIREAGFERVWDAMADAAQRYCEARIGGKIEIDALFVDGAGEVLGSSARMRADPGRWRC